MLKKIVTVLIVALALLMTAGAQSNPPAYLQQAFYGIDALQSWYTPSTGLYQTTGYWNSGNAITVLANYSRLDHTNAYFPVFANTLVQTPKSYPGFLDNYYDDQGWWALAWIAVYDVTKDPKYLATASSIFTNMTGAWDNTCGGGIWWSTDRQYKNAIANELFLSVAAELAARTADATQKATYLNWANQEWTWFHGSGMINSQNLINDGLVTATCQNNQQTTWSYNQGVILGGLTQLSSLTGDKTLLTTAQSIANATLANLTDANGVLHDVCEPNCGADGVQFKGVFLRNLMALQTVVHDPQYIAFADTNAESIWNKSQGPNFEFGQVWTGPFDAGNAGSQGSALDAILAAASMQIESSSGGSVPSFTLSASPSALHLQAGASAKSTISLASGNGFNGSVALTVTPVLTASGAPFGISANTDSSTFTGSEKTTLTISTSADTPGGNYLIAITGVSNGLSQTTYVALALPDFAISASRSALYLDQSGSISDQIAIAPINGFSNYVDLSLSTLPPGVSGRLSPPSASSSSTLRLNANVLAPTSSGSSFTLTATSRSTSHAASPISLAVSAAASDCGLGELVNLKSAYNVTALRTDGISFTDGGLDGLGSAYSATLLGPARVLNGIRYKFGAPDVANGVYAAGQTIALPHGHFNALQWLGTGEGGNQANQTLTVTYTDGSTSQFTQGFSDWFSPNLNANETEAVAMAYRNTSSGAAQDVQFNIYGYTIALDPSRTVKSLTLPDNRSVVMLAATLSLQDFGREVNLAPLYNATGIVTDGSTFASNAGLDGLGSAYSANLLGDTAATGRDLVVGDSHFHLGAPNVPDTVYAAGQTIPLLSGAYQDLKLLATGVNGNQTAMNLVVHYQDGTSETIAQTFSDWFSLGGFANESLAIRTAYRDSSNGSQDAQAFNIYLYTFKLNLRKPIKSLTLPNDRSVVILGATLAPPSIFELEPLVCRYFNDGSSHQ